MGQPAGGMRAPATEPDPQLSQAPVVLSARIAEEADHARFIVELSDPINPRVFTLANPDRVVVDMPELLWRLQAADRPSGKGFIRSYRYGLFRAGDSRLVIDLNAPVATARMSLAAAFIVFT